RGEAERENLSPVFHRRAHLNEANFALVWGPEHLLGPRVVGHVIARQQEGRFPDGHASDRSTRTWKGQAKGAWRRQLPGKPRLGSFDGSKHGSWCAASARVGLGACR